MNLSMVMEAGKLAGSIYGGMAKKKYAKDVANAQIKTQEMFYDYNKEQLEKAYNKAFSNTMTNYIADRMNMTEQYRDMETQLNQLASVSGINLSDSSFTNDAQSQLDLEFETNLQDQYTNLINQTAQLALGKANTNIQLGISNQNKMKQINDAYNMTKNNAMNEIISNAMDLGSSVIKDYGTYKSKKKLDKDKPSITDYISNDFLTFKF